jgi:hypothetical protein
MQYVSKCLKVARCCHEDLGSWQGTWEVRAALSVARMAQCVLVKEAAYAAGQVPGLPSDSSEEESSELQEVSAA